MPKIALIENSCRNKSLYLQNSCLPTFYMEDFSVLGLVVERYEEACALLQNDGYTVLTVEGGSDIQLAHPGQISTIIASLRKSGIAAQLSDIADTIYQA